MRLSVIVTTAMKSGKNVVTANKMMVRKTFQGARKDAI